jgi:hypothetical protein
MALGYLRRIANGLRFGDTIGVRRSGLRKVITFLQLRTLRSVSLTVPDTEILSHERPITVRKVASINLLGSV